MRRTVAPRCRKTPPDAGGTLAASPLYPPTMSDDNQIEIPPSFTALFADRSGTRLRTPITEVRQRYEVCEDLATHLTETARIVTFEGDSYRAQARKESAA